MLLLREIFGNFTGLQFCSKFPRIFATFTWGICESDPAIVTLINDQSNILAQKVKLDSIIEGVYLKTLHMMASPNVQYLLQITVHHKLPTVLRLLKYVTKPAISL